MVSIMREAERQCATWRRSREAGEASKLFARAQPLGWDCSGRYEQIDLGGSAVFRTAALVGFFHLWRCTGRDESAANYSGCNCGIGMLSHSERRGLNGIHRNPLCRRRSLGLPRRRIAMGRPGPLPATASIALAPGLP